MNPTDEQVKKFWVEWCGFEKIEYLDTSGNVCGIHYTHPLAVGGGSGGYPELDLKNLFKYAVPKLFDNGYELFMESVMADEPWYWWLIQKNDDELHKFNYSDPALALFWAIYKVMEAE
jgi:hypothetical protein